MTSHIFEFYVKQVFANLLAVWSELNCWIYINYSFFFIFLDRFDGRSSATVDYCNVYSHLGSPVHDRGEQSPYRLNISQLFLFTRFLHHEDMIFTCQTLHPSDFFRFKVCPHVFWKRGNPLVQDHHRHNHLMVKPVREHKCFFILRLMIGNLGLGWNMGKLKALKEGPIFREKKTLIMKALLTINVSLIYGRLLKTPLIYFWGVYVFFFWGGGWLKLAMKVVESRNG